MSEGTSTRAAARPGLMRDLLALTKPRLSSLVVFTSGGGVFLADRSPSLEVFVGGVVGTMLVVGGANALNNYIERDSDKLMARTAVRPLPQGRLDQRWALGLGLALSWGALPLIATLANPLAAALAAVALVLYVLVYTPMKRASSLSTLVGAVPGALPPLIGWTAATGQIDPGGLVLFALLFFWQIPHSLAIGMFRQQEYERAGLVVFPSEHGVVACRRQMLWYTLALVPLPLLLVPLGLAGLLTAVVGTALGGAFVVKALQGVLMQGDAKWARGFFFYTLIYLSALFAALVVDSVV